MSELLVSREDTQPYPLSSMTTAVSSDSPDVAAKRQTKDNTRRLGTKTRGSCQACANVKVRCTKERPTCTRCEDRGLTCEYLQSKRPGRVPGSSVRSTNSDPSSTQQRRKNNASEALNRKTPPRRLSEQPRSHPVNINIRNDLTPAELMSFPSPVSSVAQMDRASSAEQIQSRFLASSPGAVEYTFGGVNTSHDGTIAMDLELEMDLYRDQESETNTNMNIHMHNMNMNLGAADIDWEMLMAQTDWSHADTLCSIGNPVLGRSEYEIAGSNSDEGARDADVAAVSPHTAPPISGPFSSTARESPQMLPCTSSSASTFSGASRMRRIDLSSSSSDSGAASLGNHTPCQCMLQALDLVKTLAENQMPDAECTTNGTYSQRVLSLNKQAIEVALPILACPMCSDDRFVLMSLLMATTKILGRYALAAALCGAKVSLTTHSQSSSSMSTPVSSYMAPERRSSSDCFNRLIEIARALSGDSLSLPSVADSTLGEWCPRREDVQRVLQELHGVQSLLSQLSKRLQRLAASDRSASSNDGYFDLRPAQMPCDRIDNHYSRESARQPSPPASSGGPPATPLPPDMLSGMEENLRKNLYLFSAAMRDVLRNS